MTKLRYLLHTYWREVAVLILFLILQSAIHDAKDSAERAYNAATDAADIAQSAADSAEQASNYASDAADNASYCSSL